MIIMAVHCRMAEQQTQDSNMFEGVVWFGFGQLCAVRCGWPGHECCSAGRPDNKHRIVVSFKCFCLNCAR
jgi:hypothetical protein